MKEYQTLLAILCIIVAIVTLVTELMYANNARVFLSNQSSAGVGTKDREMDNLDIVRYGHIAPISGLISFSDGRLLLSFGQNGEIFVWDTVKKSVLQRLIPTSEVWFQGALLVNNGTEVIAWGINKVFWRWSVKNGELLTTYSGHEESIQDCNVVATKDGAELISGGYFDNKIIRWGLKSGEILSSYEPHIPNPGVGNVLGLKLINNDEEVISWSTDNTIKRWNRKTGIVNMIYEDSDYAEDVVITHDEKRIISLGNNGLIKVWDINSGRLIYCFTEQGNRLKGGVVSSDDKELISWDWEGFIARWNLETGELLSRFEAHPDGSIIRKVIFSDNENKIISCAQDGKIKIWDRYSGKLEGTLSKHVGDVNDIVMINDQIMASAGDDHTINLWSISSSSHIACLKSNLLPISEIVPMDDKRVLLFGSTNAFIFDITQKKILFSVAHDEYIRGAIVSKDKKSAFTWGDDEVVKELEVETGKVIHVYNHTKDSYVNQVLLSDDDNYLFSAGGDATIIRWNRKNGQVETLYKGHTESVHGIKLLNSRALLSWSMDGSVRLWNVLDGKCILTIQIGQAQYVKWITTILVLPSGNEIVVSAADDKVLKRYNLRDGKLIQTYYESSGIIYYSAKLSDKGDRIIFADEIGNLVFIDIASGTRNDVLHTAKKQVSNFELLPNNNILIMGSDGEFSVYNLDDKQKIADFIGHTANVSKVQFIKDKLTIFSWGEDNLVHDGRNS